MLFRIKVHATHLSHWGTYAVPLTRKGVVLSHWGTYAVQLLHMSSHTGVLMQYSPDRGASWEIRVRDASEEIVLCGGELKKYTCRWDEDDLFRRKSRPHHDRRRVILQLLLQLEQPLPQFQIKLLLGELGGGL